MAKRVRYGYFIDRKAAEDEIAKQGFQTAEIKDVPKNPAHGIQVDQVEILVNEEEMPKGIGKK